jgi:hypothetical protein
MLVVTAKPRAQCCASRSLRKGFPATHSACFAAADANLLCKLALRNQKTCQARYRGRLRCDLTAAQHSFACVACHAGQASLDALPAQVCFPLLPLVAFLRKVHHANIVCPLSEPCLTAYYVPGRRRRGCPGRLLCGGNAPGEHAARDRGDPGPAPASRARPEHAPARRPSGGRARRVRGWPGARAAALSRDLGQSAGRARRYGHRLTVFEGPPGLALLQSSGG